MEPEELLHRFSMNVKELINNLLNQYSMQFPESVPGDHYARRYFDAHASLRFILATKALDDVLVHMQDLSAEEKKSIFKVSAKSISGHQQVQKSPPGSITSLRLPHSASFLFLPETTYICHFKQHDTVIKNNSFGSGKKRRPACITDQPL